MAFIYGLRAKDSADIFYVGSTKRTLEQRLREHLDYIRLGYNKNRHLVNKVNQIGSENVVIIEIDIVPDEQQFVREYQVIQDFLQRGVNLTNIQLNPFIASYEPLAQYDDYEFKPHHLLFMLDAYLYGLPRTGHVISDKAAEELEKLSKHVIENYGVEFNETVARLLTGSYDEETEQQAADVCKRIFGVL